MKAAAVQDALVALAGTAAPEVPTSLGRPDVIAAGEAIWVSDQVEARYEPLTTGLASQMRREILTLRVFVLVAETVGEFGSRRDRAYDIAGAVERAIAADQTLGGLVELTFVSAMRTQDDPTPKGHITSVELEVTASSTLPTPS
jgi:hypothetical protein